MGRTKPYIKLDTDVKDDPKVALLIERHGKAWAWDMAMLFCALGEFYGSIRLYDDAERLRAETLTGRKGKRFRDFLAELALVDLIDQAALYEQDVVQSRRSLKDGESALKRKKYAREASAAAAAKRKDVPQR